MAVSETLHRFATLKNLKIWQKLLLIGAPFLVPIGILFFLLLSAYNEQIDVTVQEKKGIEYLAALRQFIEHVPQHRGLTQGVLSGNEAGRKDQLTARSRIADDIKALDAVDQKYGTALRSTAKWNALKARWQDLLGKVDTLKPKESFDLHTGIVADALQLTTEVSEASNLSRDPSTDGYYLQEALTVGLLPQTEYMGQARGFGTGILARATKADATEQEKTLTPDERVQLLIMLAQMRRARDVLSRDLERVLANNPALKSSLESKARENLRACDSMIDLVDKRLVNAAAITLPPGEFFTAATGTIDSSFQLYDTLEPALVRGLDARLTSLQWMMGYAVGFGVLGMALTLLIVWLVTRTITQQITAIKALFSQIGIGDFSARAEVLTNDELGEMATTLNAMLDNTLTLIQSREERDNIQGSIQKLLEEISGVADGDLSKNAEVTADMTGAIADAFNFMILQLRQIISNVQDATVQVSSSANEIHATAEHLAQGSEGQALQIVNTSAAVDEMAVSIQQVSENAATSAKVADQALAVARRGAESVNATIEGMNRIRDQVQETAKRIKRLGESSQQIGEIVQLIDDIADRTSILALNASIQAAMAGEAGRGFAVVAEEVERLAERSTNATKKIANLVKTIQSETNEAVTAMEEGTREVVDGSTLANQAGQSLSEIESVSGKLSDLIQSISLAAKQQARASEGVAKSMTEISQVTQQTAAGTKQAAVSVNGLASLADELRDSVSRFRLPGRGGDGLSLVEDGRGVRNGGPAHANGGNGNGHKVKGKVRT
jgi:twitching motility protein PilJ